MSEKGISRIQIAKKHLQVGNPHSCHRLQLLASVIIVTGKAVYIPVLLYCLRAEQMAAHFFGFPLATIKQI
jgi:hypothetical protein